MTFRRAVHPGASQYVVPGDISAIGRRCDRASEREEIGGTRQDSSLSFDAKQDVIAFGQAECIADGLRDGDLSFRAEFRCDLHGLSLLASYCKDTTVRMEAQGVRRKWPYGRSGVNRSGGCLAIRDLRRSVGQNWSMGEM